jgi:alpha-beta hydrolase superfamily lysophospholipase
MTDWAKEAELMDRPEILGKLFFPRREEVPDTRNATNRFVKVSESVALSCRFFRARNEGPNILFFHGNGETAGDYDYVAPFYQEHGLNLFVAEYRGYGMSGGTPTCSGILRDAHTVFEDFSSYVRDLHCSGPLYVMGRSLGSAPAIEVAWQYQEQLKGLIVESGIAYAGNQFARLGVTDLFKGIEHPVGFGNDLKIQATHIPTLIIHGEEDTIIPVVEGKSLYSLSGARQKTALFVPNAGHNDLLDRALKDYMEAIVRFTSDF